MEKGTGKKGGRREAESDGGKREDGKRCRIERVKCEDWKERTKEGGREGEEDSPSLAPSSREWAWWKPGTGGREEEEGRDV